jgi:hypothetical protein
MVRDLWEEGGGGGVGSVSHKTTDLNIKHCGVVVKDALYLGKSMMKSRLNLCGKNLS